MKNMNSLVIFAMAAAFVNLYASDSNQLKTLKLFGLRDIQKANASDIDSAIIDFHDELAALESKLMMPEPNFMAYMSAVKQYRNASKNNFAAEQIAELAHIANSWAICYEVHRKKDKKRMQIAEFQEALSSSSPPSWSPLLSPLSCRFRHAFICHNTDSEFLYSFLCSKSLVKKEMLIKKKAKQAVKTMLATQK